MTSPRLLIPPDSPLHRTLAIAARRRRLVFFAGIPGVGKSLLLQQLALLAHRAGRRVHLLQWDVTRAPFETAGILARYPEVDGATHLVVRKAVGAWCRWAVQRWHTRHPEAADVLIGEVALIGNRLIELTEPMEDAAEALLAGPDTRFLIPVPSREIRQVIESARDRSIASPRHPRERADAAPNILRGLWEQMYREGHELGLVPEVPASPIPYDPGVYEAVFRHLLRHRRTETLSIDALLPARGSVYDLDVVTSELAATPEEVEAALGKAEESSAGDPDRRDRIRDDPRP